MGGMGAVFTKYMYVGLWLDSCFWFGYTDFLISLTSFHYWWASWRTSPLMRWRWSLISINLISPHTMYKLITAPTEFEWRQSLPGWKSGIIDVLANEIHTKTKNFSKATFQTFFTLFYQHQISQNFLQKGREMAVKLLLIRYKIAITKMLKIKHLLAINGTGREKNSSFPYQE